MVGANLRRSIGEATLKRLPKGLTEVSVKGQRYIFVPLSAEFLFRIRVVTRILFVPNVIVAFGALLFEGGHTYEIRNT